MSADVILVIVIVTIGLFLALNSIVQVQFGSDIKTDLPRFYSQNVWRPGNVQVSADTLVLLAMLGIACFLLYLLFQHTKVGGMIVGVAQALTIQYIPALSDIVLIVPFGIILGVLMVRPQGLFGTQRVERV